MIKTSDKTATSFKDIDSAGGQTAYNAESCSVTNAVNQVFYTVKYDVTQTGVFLIKNIELDMVLHDKITRDLKYCSANTNGSTTLYQMKFGVKFEPFTYNGQG